MCWSSDDPEMKYYTTLTHVKKGMVVNVPSSVLLIPALHMNYTLINSMFMCCFNLLLALKLCFKYKHMSNISNQTHPPTVGMVVNSPAQ